MKSQFGGRSGRLQQPAPFSRKRKDVNDDDDGPTYVLEESNEILSKEQYEALVRGDEDGGDEGSVPTQTQPGKGDSAAESEQGSKTAGDKSEARTSASKQPVAEVGGVKRRKQAKVVGDEGAPKRDEDEKDKEKPQEPVSRKPKQKKRKVKLSFDDEA